MKVNYLLFTCLFILACKTKEAKKEADTPIPVLTDEFQKFYDRFHVDSIFQMSRIIFPLEGRPAMTDTVAPPADFRWQKQGWIMHKTYDDMGGTFSRSFSNFNNIIIEEISDDTGEFTMVRRFSKLNGEWHLIYYKEMGR